jgi:hypothetical protein
MKNSVFAAVIALSVVSLSLLGTSPAYATTAKDRVSIINADGTKESGQSVSSFRFSAGVYEVFWNRNITKCTANITIGSPTSFGAPAAFATAVLRAAAPSGFGHFIEIWDVNGNPVDAEFMILVSCKTL